MDVAAETLDRDLEIRFLPVGSPEAQVRGAEIAPALVINQKFIVEGVPDQAEIAELIRRARPTRLGIILTRPPAGDEDAENALAMGLASLAVGDIVDLFLISDGVWTARRCLRGPVAQALAQFQTSGGRVYASEEHLRAGGMGPQALVDGVEVTPHPIDRLVDLVMDEWDKVVVL